MRPNLQIAPGDHGNFLSSAESDEIREATAAGAVISHDPLLRPALSLLQRAYLYALDVGTDSWQFALELERLREAGLGECELRWLVHKGFLCHGRETTLPDATSRTFDRPRHVQFCQATCFVLSALGLSFATGLLRTESAAPRDDRQPAAWSTPRKPTWNAATRLLAVGSRVVKHFRVPAPNQERILNAFAEDDWVERVDDPLPPDASGDPKRRMQSAIMCLNRNQQASLIRFRGDGTGTGILWELSQPPAPEVQRSSDHPSTTSN